MFDFKVNSPYNFKLLEVIDVKFTIAQLKKRIHQNPIIEGVVDVSSFMPEDEDILAVEKAYVMGEFFIEGDEDVFVFELNIKTKLTMACARTLKPVVVTINADVEEVFTYDETDEYRQIDGLSIDLLPIIWSNIYLEKPMRVIHPDAEDMDDFIEDEETRKVNPQLKKLKDYKS